MSAGDLDTYSPDTLLAGNQQVQTKQVVVDTGVLVRGTVLGQIKAGAVPATGTAAGGNTGTGAMTAVVGFRRVKVGIYTIKCVEAKANLGVFQVTDPDGKHLGVVEVGQTFVSDQLGFTIADATDFIVGDSFTVTVPAGSGKYVKVDKALINGAGVADCILAEDADATSADVTTIGYISGQFNEDALVVAAANTIADHLADLNAKNINLKDDVVAA